MTAVANPTSGALGVALREVTRIFGDGLLTVDNISLAIEPGQFVCLLGPSGCGKSTLLRMIAGLDRPTRGQVVIESPPATGDSQPSRESGKKGATHGHIAYVFQDPHLMPWRNVLRNVALPLELRGVRRSERFAAATRAIERVGLADFTRHYPAELSGGMRMRVSLARALVTNPALLLMDEPFAALDELTRHHLDEQLHQLWREHGMTVIFVTHSTAEAAFLGQRAIVFSPRPARIVLDRILELPFPRTSKTRGTHAYATEMRTLYEALEG